MDTWLLVRHPAKLTSHYLTCVWNSGIQPRATGFSCREEIHHRAISAAPSRAVEPWDVSLQAHRANSALIVGNPHDRQTDPSKQHVKVLKHHFLRLSENTNQQNTNCLKNGMGLHFPRYHWEHMHSLHFPTYAHMFLGPLSPLVRQVLQVLNCTKTYRSYWTRRENGMSWHTTYIALAWEL